ncbi:MAG: L,D-transpeptidase [Chloroflexia bacterium]|nr:L,D-transpeptidase [Chloroflexia bacterium]
MIAGTAMQTHEVVRTETHGTGQRSAIAVVLATAALLLTMLAPLVAPTSAQEWSAPRTVYIEETGHSLDQVFLDVWRDGGKEYSYGYPITPEITLDNGHVVQYLEYARFEYWPEGNADGQQFHIANIGEELRPISLQRSIATWNSPGEAQGSDRVEQTLATAKAWLPVKAPVIAGNARYVEETRHTVRGSFLDFWERTGEAGFIGNPLTEEYDAAGSTWQVFERGQLEMAPGDEARMVPVGEVLANKYGLDQSPVAQGDVPSYDEALFVAPPEPEPEIVGGLTGGYVSGGGEVWIDINLSTQYMVVYQGNTVVMETYISSGRPGFDTPTGSFRINLKNGTQDMEGLIGGEYYNVKDVPSVMYFTNVGHAIHGAYWHNNFGAVMSHGCINVPVDLAAYLYEITPTGARVEIHW